LFWHSGRKKQNQQWKKHAWVLSAEYIRKNLPPSHFRFVERRKKWYKKKPWRVKFNIKNHEWMFIFNIGSIWFDFQNNDIKTTTHDHTFSTLNSIYSIVKKKHFTQFLILAQFLCPSNICRKNTSRIFQH
jgi:hypothetical protein